MTIDNEIKLKRPGAFLDYGFDLKPKTHGVPGYDSDWLESGETVSAYTVTASTGLTVVTHSEADGIIKFWLSGGVAGNHYSVVCDFTSSAGRIDQRTMTIKASEE